MNCLPLIALLCLWAVPTLAAPADRSEDADYFAADSHAVNGMAGLSRHFAEFDHEVKMLAEMDVASRLYHLKTNPKIVSMHLKALRQMYAAHCLQFINYYYLATAFEHPDIEVFHGVTKSHLAEISRPSTAEVRERNHAGRIARISAQLDKEAELFKTFDRKVAAYKVNRDDEKGMSSMWYESLGRQLSRASYDRGQSNGAHWALRDSARSANAEFYSAADIARDEEVDGRYKDIPPEGIPALTYGPLGSLAGPAPFVPFPEVRQWILEAYIMRIAVSMWDLEAVYAQQRMKQANPDGRTMCLPLQEEMILLPLSILNVFPLPETTDEEVLLDASNILMETLKTIDAARSSTFSLFSFAFKKTPVEKAPVVHKRIALLKTAISKLSMQYQKLVRPEPFAFYTDEPL